MLKKGGEKMKKISLILLLLFFVPKVFYSQSLLSEKLDVKTLKLLMSNNRNMVIMQKKGDKYSGGERYVGVIVNAPFEKCWKVVTDFENFKEFVPMMTESTISSKKGNEIVGDFLVEVKFLGIGCTEKYSQKYILDKANKIVKIADVKTNKVGGGWKFIPTEGGKKTILIYQDRAPITEEMCWTARSLVKISPDTELALHSSPPFLYIDALKKRIEEGRK